MNLFVLDFETYFASDYTLTNMTTEAYIRDSRFEAHGLAFYDVAAQRSWWASDHDGPTVHAALTELPRPIAVIAHHAHFDGLILSHHYGWKPDLWLDTLSMGRVVFDAGLKLNLGSLAERFSLQPKSVPYDEMRGKRWKDMSPDLRERVATGGMHDCALTGEIADQMLRGGTQTVPYAFPPSELQTVDQTVRMFTEPVLVGDSQLLADAWTAENNLRTELFARLDCTASDLRKDAYFAQLLEDMGIEPPTKLTKKGNEKFAFAKSDVFMQDLLTEDDEEVVLLAEARLKAQSSIYQTRCERLGWMASRGALCVYLSYAAAHTRRWGGGDKSNWQNLPRPDPARPQKGAIRRAIKAP